MTSATPKITDASLVRFFRGALLFLAGITSLGALAELAIHRHWKEAAQFIPWVAASLILVCAFGLMISKARALVLPARLVGLVAMAGAVLGTVLHIGANLEVGQAMRQDWNQLSTVAQYWQAATGGVGMTPPLAPGMVGLAGLLLIIGTLRWGAETAAPAAPATY